MKSRLFSGRALAGFGIACAVAISSPLILQAVVGSAAYAEDEAKPGTVRPEVGKPLQAAKAAMDAKKYSEALAHLKEADAVGNKTPFEEGLTEQLRLIAGIGGHRSGVQDLVGQRRGPMRGRIGSPDLGHDASSRCFDDRRAQCGPRKS